MHSIGIESMTLAC